MLAFLHSFSAAYSWYFNTPPRQCSDLSITIEGSSGVPPYHVLVIPYGPSPPSFNTEVRSVVDKPFEGDSMSVSFPINYPASSQFVVVVSDATGFGTGGASVATQVANSDDAHCFDAAKQVSPLFSYHIAQDSIYQCQRSRIWWNSSDVQGMPQFYGVIPGGQSFSIVGSNITEKAGEGTGFLWMPTVRAGTTLLIIGGDDRGIATAGSSVYIVQHSDDSSCLNDASPSSTLGDPARYPPTSVVSIKSTTSKSTLAIIGGTIGGVMVVAALCCTIWRCQKIRSKPRAQLNLVDESSQMSNDPQYDPTGRNGLPENYHLGPILSPQESAAYPVPESEIVRDATWRQMPGSAKGGRNDAAMDVAGQRARRPGVVSLSLVNERSRKQSEAGVPYERSRRPSEAAMSVVNHMMRKPSATTMIMAGPGEAAMSIGSRRKPSTTTISLTSQSGLSYVSTHGDTSALGYKAEVSGLEQDKPIAVIQHEDAGPSRPIESNRPVEPLDNNVETVELPPAYSKIKGASQFIKKLGGNAVRPLPDLPSVRT